MTDDYDDDDWNRGLNAWHSWRARAWDDTMDEIATRLNRSLHPDDSNSNLNDKIDVTEWSEGVESIEGLTAEVFLNVPSVTSDYTRRRREGKRGKRPFE